MPFLKRSSYYKPDYSQSAALIRARRPYLFGNLAIGATLIAFTLSVYSFTIRAVGQEKFEDVIVPDKPVQSPKTPNVAANGRSS